MTKILFICHGNICRSAAAEAIAKDIVHQKGLDNDYYFDSAAVSSEEIGNPMYPPMRRELESRGIPIPFHRARRVSQKDIETFDVVFYMDSSNERLLRYQGLLKDNVISLCEYGSGFDEIEDPWYSGRYGLVVGQISICIKNYLSK